MKTVPDINEHLLSEAASTGVYTAIDTVQASTTDAGIMVVATLADGRQIAQARGLFMPSLITAAALRAIEQVVLDSNQQLMAAVKQGYAAMDA